MLDDFRHKGLRRKMVNHLELNKGISNSFVVSALLQVPRHAFLDSSFLEFAYDDKPFPIGSGQTISSLYTVAFQTQLLDVKPKDKILEIGTGSGYQTAVLAEMGAKIYSIERHEILENLYKTTIVDELTGLYNRRGLLTLGNQQVELAKRQNDDIFIFFLDLDGMKIINDTLGHEFGDKALVDTSKVMHKSFRTTDILSRIGGDEFVVVAVKAQYEFIPIIIDRVKDFVKQINEENNKFELSMSIGVSKVNLDAESPLEDAIRDADKKMYDAKQKNKKSRS